MSARGEKLGTHLNNGSIGAADQSGPVPPSWPFLLLVAVIPLQNVYLGKIPTLGAGINFLNVLLLVAFLWTLRRNQNPIAVSPTLGRLLLSLLLVYLLSIGVSLVRLGFIPEGSFVGLKDIFVGISFYFLVLRAVHDQNGVRWVLGASFLPLPYMFYVFRDQLVSVQRWHYTDNMRTVSSTFMELGSNEIAAFYATYTLILIAAVIVVKNTTTRLVLLPLVLLNGYCVMFSYSRGAYLSIVAGLLVLMWQRSKNLAIVVALAFVLSTSVFIDYLPVSVQERVGTITVEEEDRDASAQSRFELWEIAFDEFKKSPILGIGFRAFREVGPTGQDTHNYFVKVLTEQGLLGFGLIVAIFLLILRRSFALARRAKDPLYIALGTGMLACSVAVIIGNMFGDRFTHYPLIAYFWCYAALVHKAIELGSLDRHSSVSAGE